MCGTEADRWAMTSWTSVDSVPPSPLRRVPSSPICIFPITVKSKSRRSMLSGSSFLAPAAAMLDHHKYVRRRNTAVAVTKESQTTIGLSAAAGKSTSANRLPVGDADAGSILANRSGRHPNPDFSVLRELTRPGEIGSVRREIARNPDRPYGQRRDVRAPAPRSARR
jgi:hypothetical protein